MSSLNIAAEDLYTYKFPHDISCSPDGLYAACLVTQMDKGKDGYQHDICLLSLKDGKKIMLTQTGDIGAFSWISADDIIFQSARDGQKKGTTDIFRISVHGGEAVKLFTVPVSTALPVPLGDGRWLIQTRKATDPKEAEADRAQEGVDYWTFTDYPFLKNGEDFSERKRTALGIYDEADNSIRYITDRYFETEGYDIAADRKQILYYGELYTDCAAHFHSLCCYQMETGEIKELVRGGTYQISLARFTASGNIILQASRLDRSVTQNHDMYLWKAEDKSLSMLQSPDGMYTTLIDVDAVYGAGRSSRVLGETFIGYRLEKSMTRIDELDTVTGQIRKIAEVDAMTSFDVSGEYLYAVALENYEPVEIYQIHMASGEKKKLTGFSEDYLRTHRVSLPEKIEWIAENQEGVEGFVIPPAEFDEQKKYPGILFIHGGPKWAAGASFMHLYQCLAAKGMFVFYCNPHGSDGYGENFLEMTCRWGQTDYRHLMEFTDECLKRYPNLDPERLGVSGGSYGGYMTNWIIGHTNRFRAAVCQRGISNLVTLSLLSDLGDRVMKQSCGTCTPWEHEEVLWEQSPLKYAGNVSTPTLFIHSDKDFRCFMGEAFQMFTALKQKGTETELILFQGETHGLSRAGKPSRRVARVEAILEWFEKHL